MISQNNSIVISVCNLACAARFRANAGAKSVGMIGCPHAHPSCAETMLTGPLQFPTEPEIWQHPAVGRSSERQMIGSLTNMRRGEYRQAAGAFACLKQRR
jgi:hypothetical protein